MTKEKQLTARFPAEDVKRIKICVEKGHARNVAEFIRNATLEKIVEIGIKPTTENMTQVIFAP
jgi:Arc/MetJ-type ribon-helix-helix transcriptional regulator